ncbi:MAG: hypothetical protein JO222_04305 [Frankiales bacterium]|nr:hypothetical protein [Frankiales bacterium]
MGLRERLNRLDTEVLGPPDAAEQHLARFPEEAARRHIRIGVIWLIGDLVLAAATSNLYLIFVAPIWLIIGLARLRTARAQPGSRRD